MKYKTVFVLFFNFRQHCCLCWRHLALGIFNLLMSVMHCLPVCQFFFWYSQEWNNTFSFFLPNLCGPPGNCSARPNMNPYWLSLMYGLMWPQITASPLLFFRQRYHFSDVKSSSQVLNTSQLDPPNPNAMILYPLFWVGYLTLLSPLLTCEGSGGFPPSKTVERGVHGKSMPFYKSIIF